MPGIRPTPLASRGRAVSPGRCAGRRRVAAQLTPALDVDRPVDRLVAHAHLLVGRMRQTEVVRDLRRRPAQPEQPLDLVAQAGTSGEPRGPRTTLAEPGRPLGREGAVLDPAPVAPHLPADRRGRPLEVVGDLPVRLAHQQSPADLLAVRRTQAVGRALPGRDGVGDGATPPRRPITSEMTLVEQASEAAIAGCSSPARQRCQISAMSPSLSIPNRTCDAASVLLQRFSPLSEVMLHRPVECAGGIALALRRSFQITRPSHAPGHGPSTRRLVTGEVTAPPGHRGRVTRQVTGAE